MGIYLAIVVKALLAQWLERATVNRKVIGSIPIRSAFFVTYSKYFPTYGGDYWFDSNTL